MRPDIVLSICIASYNHGVTLAQKIRHMLSYSGDDLEVVVSDNCSTDQTVELLSDIKDSRFRLITNSENKGPTPNYTKALASGRGKYVMFMTDKDFLVYANIRIVINALREQNFSCGYFVLDYLGADPKINYYRDLEHCLKLFAYQSKHPTGYIYQRDALHNLDIEDFFSKPELVGSFPFEFLCAELCLHQTCVIIEIAFCVTAKLIGGKQTERSMTYSGRKNNLFFSPEYRFKMFEKYCSHLNTLKISRRVRLNTASFILLRAYDECVNFYPSVLRSEPHRFHYGISEDEVAALDINKIRKNFARSLRRTAVFKNETEKCRAILALCLHE